jgi:pyruvate dehydrogenase E1 component beta subunit
MKGMLKTAVRCDDPVILIEQKLLYFSRGEVPEGEYLVPFGVADVKREGADVTILATSWMVLNALKAAEELAKDTPAGNDGAPSAPVAVQEKAAEDDPR